MADHPQPDDVATGSDVLEVLAKAAFEAQHQPAVRTPLEGFLDQYRNDREEDAVRPLRKYLELFPGDERALAREYLALETALGEDSAAGLGRRSAESALSYGHYRVLKEIGRGGQGVVYLAEDSNLNRRVALKALTGLIPASEDTLRRFRREAEVASRLDHPGICAVYEAGIEDREPYIAMRYVEGETLARRITTARRSAADGTGSSVLRLGTTAGNSADATSSEPTSSPSTTATRAEVMLVVKLFEQAARALHVAHEAGIVHRDVKPGNIMVTQKEEPVILDFGLARDTTGDAKTLTRSGALFGTPAYMSPEQLAAQRVQLDRRTDVYSLGVSLYETLTLNRPFDEPTRQALYQSIQSKEPVDPRRLNRAISKDLKVVIATCLQKEPDRRYQTAEALAGDLQAVREGRPIAAKPVPVVTRAWLWVRREPAKAALLLAAVILTGLGGYIIARWPDIQKGINERQQDRVEALLENGFQELLDGELKPAAASFEVVLQLDCDAPEAIAGLALAYFRLRRPQAALDLLITHEIITAHHQGLVLLRSDALHHLGQEQESMNLLAQFGGREPQDALDFFLLGSRFHLIHQDTGNTEARVRAFDLLKRAVLQSKRARPLYYYRLADAIRARTEPGSTGLDHAFAREIADVITALWPDSWRAWRASGHCLVHVDAKKAARAFRKAIELGPDDIWETWSNLATCLDDKDEVIAIYRRLLKLHPSPVVYYNLGLNLREKGLLDEAIEAYDAALEIAPELAKAHEGRGTALAALGRDDEAIAAYRRALEINSRLPIALNNLGNALTRRGMHREAIAARERAIELVPDYVSAHHNLAISLKKAGDIDRPLEVLLRALEIDLGCSKTYDMLGQALTWHGRPEDAIAVFKKAIELDPGNPTVREMLRMRLRERGEPALTDEAGSNDVSKAELARIAALRNLHADATALFEEAFADDPAMLPRHRYRAARSAVRAGCQQGDAPSWEVVAQSGWRRQALTWMRANLNSLTERLSGGEVMPRRLIKILGDWEQQSDLAGVREPDALARLPASERKAWGVFWNEVAQVIAELE